MSINILQRCKVLDHNVKAYLNNLKTNFIVSTFLKIEISTQLQKWHLFFCFKAY